MYKLFTFAKTVSPSTDPKRGKNEEEETEFALRELYAFEEEAYGAEAVVAGDEGRMGVAHPAVVKIAASGSEFGDEPLHAFPSAWAEAFGLHPVAADPDLAFEHIARVLDGVLIDGLQVLVVGLADGGYLDVEHGILFLGSAKIRYFFDIAGERVCPKEREKGADTEIRSWFTGRYKID